MFLLKFSFYFTFLLLTTKVSSNSVNLKYQVLSLNTKSAKCGPGFDCVPYYLCQNKTIVSDGTGIIDARFGEEAHKECINFLEICCSLDEISEETREVPGPAAEGCGFRNVDGVGFRITDNRPQETQYGEFPWMIAILREEEIEQKLAKVYQCGGSLIHPSVVLTAAHCVAGILDKKIKARAGEWDTQTKLELYPTQDRDVVDIIIHEKYYKGGLFNDIALLILNSPMELTENVNTICLPPANFNFDHIRCLATGWGKNAFGRKGKYQTILKKVDLPVIPANECEKKLRLTRLGRYFRLHQSFICAGGEPGRDTCKGDGGSPLVCPIPGSRNLYYQAGLVAWGIGCGENKMPGVYANIALARNWIDKIFGDRLLDSSYYSLNL